MSDHLNDIHPMSLATVQRLALDSLNMFYNELFFCTMSTGNHHLRREQPDFLQEEQLH